MDVVVESVVVVDANQVYDMGKAVVGVGFIVVVTVENRINSLVLLPSLNPTAAGTGIGERAAYRSECHC